MPSPTSSRRRPLIRLAKRPEPEVLVENRESWTEEYAAYRRGDAAAKSGLGLLGAPARHAGGIRPADDVNGCYYCANECHTT